MSWAVKNLEADEELEISKWEALTDKVCMFVNPEVYSKISEMKKASNSVKAVREKPRDISEEEKKNLQEVIKKKLKREAYDPNMSVIESSEDIKDG